jgi:hypothetical protein
VQGRCAAVLVYHNNLALLQSTGTDSLEAVQETGGLSQNCSVGSSYLANLPKLGIKDVPPPPSPFQPILSHRGGEYVALPPTYTPWKPCPETPSGSKRCTPFHLFTADSTSFLSEEDKTKQSKANPSCCPANSSFAL